VKTQKTEERAFAASSGKRGMVGKKDCQQKKVRRGHKRRARKGTGEKGVTPKVWGDIPSFSARGGQREDSKEDKKKRRYLGEGASHMNSGDSGGRGARERGLNLRKRDTGQAHPGGSHSKT